MNYRDAFFSERTKSSDKWEHYFDIYDHLFAKYYGKSVTYVEIGVQGGGSLEIARKLFASSSQIIGVDVDETCQHLEADGVASRIFIASQVDSSLDSLLRDSVGGIDILIDDGSHIQAHMIQTFLMLWPLVNEGGVYVIEDTHTNYSKEHQDDFHGLGLYDYFKGLAERLNLDFIDPSARRFRFKTPREKRSPEDRVKKHPILESVFSIEFFNSIIAIRKRSLPEPLRLRR